MQTALRSIILLLVYLFCASARPLWPFSAVASVEAAEREVVTAALHNHHEMPVAESNRNMISSLASSWLGGVERPPLTSANRLDNSAHSAAAEAGGGIASNEINDAVSMVPSLVERLPENGRRTIDTIKSLIETIITTFKTVIRDIKNKYQDIKDLYRLFYPLPPRETLPVERPNTIVGSLQRMWDNRPTPVKNANIVMQKKIMATRADALIQSRLKWLPNSLKPKTRQWMIDNAPWLFDALCNGKTNTNPRIQQLAAEIQLKIAKANPSVNNMIIEAICLFKKSPI